VEAEPLECSRTFEPRLAVLPVLRIGRPDQCDHVETAPQLLEALPALVGERALEVTGDDI